MPLFTETLSIHSALPPHALLDRIRGLAAGTLPMPAQSRWRSPVRWALRQQPHGIRLMALFPPNFREQHTSFIGAIDAEGSGSGVKGRIQPYGLTVAIVVLLVLFAGAAGTASVVQESSRHRPGKAVPVALCCIGFGAVALAMLRFDVWFSAGPIRQLLATAASDDSHATATATVGSSHAMVPGTEERSNARLVLRAAAAIDALMALFLITTSFVSSRAGRPVTLVIAAALTSGAGFLWIMANRFPARRD
jgi:hypothetical protein